MRAGRVAELDDGGADGGGAADHEQLLPRLQLRPPLHRQVPGVERQRERGGLDVVELGRGVEHAGHAGERVVGDAAERLDGRGHDPAPDPLLAALARRLDHAAHVHADGEGHLAHHAGDGAAAAGDVAVVERRRRHLHQRLTRPGLGDRDVLELQRLQRLGVLDHSDCSHDGSPVGSGRFHLGRGTVLSTGA